MSDPITPAGSVGQDTTAALAGWLSLPTRTSQKADSAQTTAATSETPTLEQQLQQELAAAQQDQKKAQEAAPNIEEAAKAMADYINNLPSDLEFRRDEESGYTIFRVVNPVTREVIREYPPKEVVEMARRLKSFLKGDGSGVLIDQQS
nr:flagellar protein FlaG [uncultured Holophaga sp.]